MCKSPKLPVFLRFRIKILYAFLKLPMHSTCPSTTAATTRFTNLHIMQFLATSRQIMRVRQLYKKAALCDVDTV